MWITEPRGPSAGTVVIESINDSAIDKEKPPPEDDGGRGYRKQRPNEH